jgi:hypothetical protein
VRPRPIDPEGERESLGPCLSCGATWERRRRPGAKPRYCERDPCQRAKERFKKQRQRTASTSRRASGRPESHNALLLELGRGFVAQSTGTDADWALLYRALAAAAAALIAELEGWST